jgi:hypothetical protein
MRMRIKELKNIIIGYGGSIEYSIYKKRVGEEKNVDERDIAKCLISFLKDGGNQRLEVPVYDGNLKEETLMDWIGEIKRYFEYENVQYPNRVCFSIKKLKGNAILCWDVVKTYKVDKQ